MGGTPSWRTSDNYLRRLRLDANLSLRAAATHIGCSPNHLARIERGSGNPSDELLQAIAGIYHLRPSELIDALRRHQTEPAA